MARKGRPPASRPAIDHGTPELQARRARLAGPGDPALVSYPLGVLLANGDVGEDAHQAGCRYAWLYGFVFGRTGAAARGWIDAPKPEPRDLPEPVAAAIEADFRAAAGVIGMLPAAKRALENLVVFGSEPRWMRPVAPTPADVVAAKIFHQALAVLSRHFREGGLAGSKTPESAA
jgi:hypothetical protein